MCYEASFKSFTDENERVFGHCTTPGCGYRIQPLNYMPTETPLGEQIDGGNDHVEDSLNSALNEDNNAGWPGDGSGEDDFADYNANEADDYSNE